MGTDDEAADALGGAIGGVARQELPQIVANLLADHETKVEVWIRPGRIRNRSTVEWTTLEYDSQEQDWRARDASSHKSVLQSAYRRIYHVVRHITASLTTRILRFRGNREPINVFAAGNRYLFRHYFKQNTVFRELRRYYNEQDYRFEIPEEAFADVQDTLEDHFYDPIIVDDPERFCVVHRKYSEHPDVLFKASVLQRHKSDHHIFL